MDRVSEAALKALSTTKRCADCAFARDGSLGLECERTAYVEPASGKVLYRTCSLERSLDAIGCGERAIHFIPTPDAQAARSVRRLALGNAIEQAIPHLSPDPVAAAECIVDPLAAALKARYGEQLPDVQELLEDLRKALIEADGVSDGSPA